MTDVDIDQNAVGSGANTGEEATESGESAAQINALTGTNREGFASPKSGQVVGRFGIVLEEDVECLYCSSAWYATTHNSGFERGQGC